MDDLVPIEAPEQRNRPDTFAAYAKTLPGHHLIGERWREDRRWVCVVEADVDPKVNRWPLSFAAIAAAFPPWTITFDYVARYLFIVPEFAQQLLCADEYQFQSDIPDVIVADAIEDVIGTATEATDEEIAEAVLRLVTIDFTRATDWTATRNAAKVLSVCHSSGASFAAVLALIYAFMADGMEVLDAVDAATLSAAAPVPARP